MREWNDWLPMATRMPEPDPIVAIVFLEVARSLVGPPEEQVADGGDTRVFAARTVSAAGLAPSGRVGHRQD